MRIVETVLTLIASFLISVIINGCTSERDRADVDRKIFRLERHVEERLERFRDRRDDGGRDDRRPFRPGMPGAGPIGAEPAAADGPSPAATSAVGDVGTGVTLKLESGL